MELRAEYWLGRCEAGETSLWVQLHLQMCIETGATGWQYLGNILETPGWSAVDAGVRERIVKQATLYLREGDPDDEAWLDSGSRPWSGLCGAAAMALVFSEDPASFHQVPSETLEGWTASVLSARLGQPEFLEALYAKAATRFREAYARLLVHRADEARDLLGPVWDGAIERALLTSLSDLSMPFTPFKGIVRLLVQRGSSETLQGLRDQATSEGDTDRAGVLWAGLLLSRPQEMFDSIKLALSESVAVRRAVLRELAQDSGAFPCEGLSEDQLAKLFEWASEEEEGVRAEPTDSDDPDSEWSLPQYAPAEPIRTKVLNCLLEQRSERSCEVLRSLAGRYPHLTGIPIWAERAEKAFAQNAWRPLQPSHVRAILDSRIAGVVRSGDDLLQLTIEALERVEASLHGETAMGRIAVA